MISFKEIYESYKCDVFNFLYSLTENEMNADELTQETFYYAYLGISQYKGSSSLRTWLFAIAKKRFLKSLKKKKLIPFSDDLFNKADSKDVEEYIVDKVVIEDSLNIIFSMNPIMKEVFLLRVYSFKSYSEISSLLGISESSARVTFFRSKQFLKKKLKEVYGYEL